MYVFRPDKAMFSKNINYDRDHGVFDVDAGGFPYVWMSKVSFLRRCQKLTLNLRQPQTKSGYRWILVRDTHSSNLAFVVVFTMERAAYQDCFTICALSVRL